MSNHRRMELLTLVESSRSSFRLPHSIELASAEEAEAAAFCEALVNRVQVSSAQLSAQTPKGAPHILLRSYLFVRFA